MSNHTASDINYPLVDTVDSLQNQGRDVYILGLSRDLTRALVVDNDQNQATVASPKTTSGLGRWECSKDHLLTYFGHYTTLFPRRLSDLPGLR